jgi:hypothetical protein
MYEIVMRAADVVADQLEAHEDRVVEGLTWMSEARRIEGRPERPRGREDR